ncbi:hypothetical protein MTO96_032812 [Rhipicephalus appendiculatus]
MVLLGNTVPRARARRDAYRRNAPGAVDALRAPRVVLLLLALLPERRALPASATGEHAGGVTVDGDALPGPQRGEEESSPGTGVALPFLNLYFFFPRIFQTASSLGATTTGRMLVEDELGVPPPHASLVTAVATAF